MTVGSYELYRPTLDFSGPLVSDGSLLYRLNVAYENADSFRDFNENESFFVAPALTWKIGPRTNLTVEFEQQRQSCFFDNGFPAEPEFLRLPIERFVLGEPDLNRLDADSNSITYNFEHQFSDNWRFRQGFNALIVDLDAQSAFFDSLEEDDLPRFASRSNEQQENYTLQNEIFGEFETGPLRHNILFGLELARYRFDYEFEDADLASINILNPQYGAQPGEFILGNDIRYGSDNLGVYLQDLIEVLPNLKILAGGRFDYNDSLRRDRLDDELSNDQTDNDFSPLVGIVYQPIESTSLYFNWSNSFAPGAVFGRSRTGELFQPTTGEQFEVGIKQEFLNNQLSATLAFYDITRQNVLTTDQEEQRFSIQTGEQKSRGIELDIVGELLPGWKIIANYAYIDAFVSEDEEPIFVGDRLDGVPKHSASLWTTYEIQSGNLQGLGFGAGLVFVGEREAILPNDDGIELDSYVRTDAALFYQRNNWRVALNIENLFDIKYYESIENFTIFPGEPLTLRGTVSVQL